MRITPAPDAEMPCATWVNSWLACESYSNTVARSALSKSRRASMTVDSTSESSLDSAKRRETISNLVITSEGIFLNSCFSIGSIGFVMVAHPQVGNGKRKECDGVYCERFYRSAEAPNFACAPSSSAMRRRRLYLAVRSLRHGAPVLICPQFVATARSAIV